MKHEEQQESMANLWERTETLPEEVQTMDLLYEDFSSSILNML